MSKKNIAFFLYQAFIHSSAFIHLQTNVLNDGRFCIIILPEGKWVLPTLLSSDYNSIVTHTKLWHALKESLQKHNGEKLPHSFHPIIKFSPFPSKSFFTALTILSSHEFKTQILARCLGDLQMFIKITTSCLCFL